MFQQILQRFFNYPETRKEETPNIDYVLLYDSGKGVNPADVNKRLKEFNAAQKDKKDVVLETLANTATWLKSIGVGKPRTHLYAKQEEVRLAPNQKEQKIIILYEMEISDWSIIAFFQNRSRKDNAELAKKVFSELYTSIENQGIQKQEINQILHPEDLGELVKGEAALNIMSIRSAINSYEQPDYDQRGRAFIPADRINPEQETVHAPADETAEVGFTSSPIRGKSAIAGATQTHGHAPSEDNPKHTASFESESSGDDHEIADKRTGRNAAFSPANSPSVSEEERDRSLGGTSSATPSLRPISVTGGTERKKVEDSATSTAAQENNHEESSDRTRTDKNRAHSSPKPPKKKNVREARIENPDGDESTYTQAVSAQKRITLGDFVNAEDLRNADMLVLSASGLDRVDPEITDEFFAALPPKIFNQDLEQPAAVPVNASSKNGKTRFFVPLAEMPSMEPTESDPMSSRLGQTVSEVDLLWETVSSLAAEKSARKLVVIPSYPLGLDEVSNRLLANTMLKALRRGLAAHAKVEIKLIPRTAEERHALQTAIARWEVAS